MCYGCNKKGHYKLECPELKDKKDDEPKKQQRKKVLKVT